MSRRFRSAPAAAAATFVLAFLVAGCTGSPAPSAQPSAAAGGVQVARRANDLRITVPPVAGLDAIQVFVCPTAIRIDPGDRPTAVAGSSDCVDLGIGSAAEGLQVAFPFDSLAAPEWRRFDEARTWSVLVTESPDPDHRQGRHQVSVVAGGPLPGEPPPPATDSP